MQINFLRFALIGALVAPLLYSQSDVARIAGTVTDPSGAVIPGAAVTVKDEKTSQERKAATDAAGFYVIPNLAPSTYTVKAESTGLSPAQYTGVPLNVGQERVLNIVLQPSTVTTEVNVSGGELTVIDMSSAAVGANINAREVAQLPLNGRQLSQLYLLAPGAQTAGGGSFDNIRFSGRAVEQNIIRLDK